MQSTKVLIQSINVLIQQGSKYDITKKKKKTREQEPQGDKQNNIETTDLEPCK